MLRLASVGVGLVEVVALLTHGFDALGLTRWDYHTDPSMVLHIRTGDCARKSDV
jgi:hypothetical protein